MTSQRCLLADEKVALLGITQSCFESAMFIFVFEWTPALESSASTMHLPHGLIFAVFMVCIMIGSNLFKTFLGWQPVEHFSRGVFVVSSVALAVPVFFTVRGGLLAAIRSARVHTLHAIAEPHPDSSGVLCVRAVLWCLLPKHGRSTRKVHSGRGSRHHDEHLPCWPQPRCGAGACQRPCHAPDAAPRFLTCMLV